MSTRLKENLHPKRDAGFLSFGAADLALNQPRFQRGGSYNDFAKYIAPYPQICYNEIKKGGGDMKKTVAFLMILILLFCLSSCANINEESAYNAVKEHYDDVEIIEIVPVYSHGEKTDTACVARTSEGVVAGELYVFTGSMNVEFEPRILFANNDNGRESFKAMVSERFILHGFSEEKESINEEHQDESLEIVEFEEKGKTYYYYVVYLD